MKRGTVDGLTPLTDRMEQFWTLNPDEELTIEDMAIKFGAPLESCQVAMKRMCKRRGWVFKRVVVFRLED